MLSPLSSLSLSLLPISSVSLKFTIITAVWCFLLPFPQQLVLLVNGVQLDCNILDPKCRERYPQMFHSTSAKSNLARCSQQAIWLIPGKADASCFLPRNRSKIGERSSGRQCRAKNKGNCWLGGYFWIEARMNGINLNGEPVCHPFAEIIIIIQFISPRPGSKKILEMDPRHVVIRPKVVKFPGCFNIEIKNIRVLDNNDAMGNSFFAKVEYQWWNVKDFTDLKCQNASNNGCGGYGNNCYYCDICESLQQLQEDGKQSTLMDQLRGIKCPKYPGFYTFRKEFCFNDWSTFDSDNDCQFDFLQSDKLSDYRLALSSLQQVGHGTVVVKLRLATNATVEIAEKKRIKEELIGETIKKELEERRKKWDVSNEQFEKFRQWYINHRRETWHREEYLPWLLYENEISCIRLTFDVCERVPKQSPFTGQLTCF
uniref:DUF7753 domain-containing protein n=1 Tax=Setaria digitata TaxID=48799 RepID=A0A915Q0Z7_9BILA